MQEDFLLLSDDPGVSDVLDSSELVGLDPCVQANERDCVLTPPPLFLCNLSPLPFQSVQG